MKKLKNNSGSVLVLALFLMVLVSTIIVSFSNQVSNQIKSTINLDKDMQKMYNTESKIEECIAEFIKSINLNLENDNYNINYTENLIKEVKDKDEKIINTVNMTTNNQHKKIPANTTNTTIQLDITEGSTNLNSCIKVQISNIKNTQGKITYEIDYGVESWRIRN